MHQRIKILKACNVAQGSTIDTTHNAFTLSYVNGAIQDALNQSKNTKIVFLGDIVDNAYLKEKDMQSFIDLLNTYQDVEKIIILGNHDTSSVIPDNKLKYSSLKHITNHVNLTLITDFEIEVQDTTVLVYWSYAQKKDMYEKLHLIFNEVFKITKTTCILNIILMTHNNIYLTDTFLKQQMFPVSLILKMMEEAHIDIDINLMIINGHIHATHYEKIHKY